MQVELDTALKTATVRLDRARARQLYWLVSGLSVAQVKEALQRVTPPTLEGLTMTLVKPPQRDVRAVMELIRTLRQGLRALPAGSPAPRARGPRPRAERRSRRGADPTER